MEYQLSPNLRQRELNNLGEGDKQIALHYFDGKCCYCGVTVTRELGHDNSLEFDHANSLASQFREDDEIVLDGTIQNRVPSCRKCNRRKGDLDYEEWVPKAFPMRAEEIVEKIQIYFALQQEELF